MKYHLILCSEQDNAESYSETYQGEFSVSATGHDHESEILVQLFADMPTEQLALMAIHGDERFRSETSLLSLTQEGTKYTGALIGALKAGPMVIESDDDLNDDDTELELLQPLFHQALSNGDFYCFSKTTLVNLIFDDNDPTPYRFRQSIVDKSMTEHQGYVFDSIIEKGDGAAIVRTHLVHEPVFASDCEDAYRSVMVRWLSGDVDVTKIRGLSYKVVSDASAPDHFSLHPINTLYPGEARYNRPPIEVYIPQSQADDACGIITKALLASNRINSI